jgi:hypothetical protein
MKHNVWTYIWMSAVGSFCLLVGLALWVTVFGYSDELKANETAAYDEFGSELDLQIGGNIGSWLLTPLGLIVYPFDSGAGSMLCSVDHVEMKFYNVDPSTGQDFAEFSGRVQSIMVQNNLKPFVFVREDNELIGVYYQGTGDDAFEFHVVVLNDEHLIMGSVDADFENVLDIALEIGERETGFDLSEVLRTPAG